MHRIAHICRIFILNSGAKIQKRNQIPPFGRFLFTHLANFRSVIWLIFVREFGLCPQKRAAATFFVMINLTAECLSYLKEAVERDENFDKELSNQSIHNMVNEAIDKV